MMNGLQSVTHWQNYFGTPKGATLGFFNAAYPLGGIAGVFTSDLQQTLTNATSQMLSWASAVYFATLPAKLGRRTLFLGSLYAMCVVDICITAGSAFCAKPEPPSSTLGSVAQFLA